MEGQITNRRAKPGAGHTRRQPSPHTNSRAIDPSEQLGAHTRTRTCVLDPLLTHSSTHEHEQPSDRHARGEKRERNNSCVFFT